MVKWKIRKMTLYIRKSCNPEGINKTIYTIIHTYITNVAKIVVVCIEREIT